jgi:hypothetical protein
MSEATNEVRTIFHHIKKAAAPAGINDYEDDHRVRESA